MGCLSFLQKPISVFFEYDTPKIVHIQSKKVGIIGRLLQLIIIAYIVGFVLVWKKGYQETGDIHSTVNTKVKGVAYTKNITSQELQLPNKEHVNLYRRIWDSSDYGTLPPSGLEEGGFFIMTNVIITPNQTRGTCPEDPKISPAHCSQDSDCPPGHSLTIGNGVFTGKCIKSDKQVSTCEIYSWCPVERDELPFNGTRALLREAENFTVLIKNSIDFPKFGPQYKRRNIFEDSANASYLQGCLYNSDSDPFCPVFRLGDIVKSAGEDFEKVAIFGGVFEIRISWFCNLDSDFLEYCKPKYSFSRMDNPNALISPGWNFRSADFHEDNRRTLYKRYGLKFSIKVEGQAGKFNLVPLLLNIGSGLALLGIATIVCDFLLMYCLKNKRLYKKKKYLTVKGEDAFQISSPPRPNTEGGVPYTQVDESNNTDPEENE